jgi:hypothetical protein
MTTTDLITILVNAALIPVIAWGINKLFAYLDSKSKSVKLDKYLDMANDAVVTAVKETMQTFVLSLKNSGQWNEQTAKEALQMSVLKAQQIIGAAALQALPEVVGDLQVWLTSKVEAATLEIKNATALQLKAATVCQ